MRTCSHCGKPMMLSGFTNEYGDFYCHESCFPRYMDNRYGKHKWMIVDDDGNNGYYMVSDSNYVGGMIGTGIYWTEWESEEEVV